jgi:hypothetical protein
MLRRLVWQHFLLAFAAGPFRPTTQDAHHDDEVVTLVHAHRTEFLLREHRTTMPGFT